jgi:glycosyltransferase involved in cell wall biosynthesis
MTHTLSVVIITYNEEKNIGRCLTSIREVADEIVVVDSLSSDRTAEICRENGVRFILQPFLGNIQQQSFALKQATCDFILSLDADEALSDELKASILQEKKSGFRHDGYTMSRCTNFCGKWIKHGSWYPDEKLRLINKQNGNWGGVEPHGKIVMQENSRIKKLKGDLLHYSYYAIEEVISRNNKYTTIMAQTLFSQGKKAPWYKLAINPLYAFISGYLFRLGFLDGADGFFIASSVAYQTMIKYAKLRKLQKDNQKKT